MNDPILDPDGARERLAAWKGRIDKLAADTQAMSQGLQSLQETATDPRGMARVTVDSTGSLIGLQLTPQIREVPPEYVAQAVMETIRRAKERIAQRSQDIIASTVGTETAAGQAIANSVAQHLRAGSPAEQPPAPPSPLPSPPPPVQQPRAPQPPPRRQTVVDDDDDEPFELKL